MSLPMLNTNGLSLSFYYVLLTAYSHLLILIYVDVICLTIGEVGQGSILDMRNVMLKKQIPFSVRKEQSQIKESMTQTLCSI